MRLIADIAELAAIGWRITELRPERLDGRVVLWHVAIVRVDDVATMTACASDPDVALAELVRYTAPDANVRARVTAPLQGSPSWHASSAGQPPPPSSTRYAR
jgi:hypothetical protein